NYLGRANRRFNTNKKVGELELQNHVSGSRQDFPPPRDNVPQTRYDPRGAIDTVTDQPGQPAPYSDNNDSGGLDPMTYTDGSTATTVNYTLYDNNGNLKTLSEGTQTIQRTYDNLDRVISYTDANGQQIQYRYYKSGRIAKIIYPGGSANDTGHVEYLYW